jgi:serine/threonine protein kinase
MQMVPCPKCGQPAEIDSFCANDGTRIVATGGAAQKPSFNTGSSPSRIALVKGARVGEYIIEDFLGKGGFGEVWSAQHPAIGKQVAVKFLSANSLINFETLARFKREAKAVNDIGHENLVDIFSFGELPDGRPYYVMELLRGESLAEYVAKKGAPPFALLLEVFRQVCAALQAAHDTKVVHRDLKPDNIFLDKKKAPALSVKLLDFGIAKLASSEEEGVSLTRTGIPFGTPAYMSPEQCDGAKNVDHRSDIYSLGIVLYELLTGRNPFRESGDSALDLLMKHKKTVPPPPSSVAPERGIPKEVDALVLKAIAKKPADRFDSATEVYEQLVKVLPKEGGVAPQAQSGYDPTLPPTTKELAPRKDKRWVWGAVSMVLISVVAGLAYFLSPNKPPIPTKIEAPQSQSKPAPTATNNWKPRVKGVASAEKVFVSSSIKQDQDNSYSEDKTFDEKPNTSWCEGVAGDGVGEWFAFIPKGKLEKPSTLKITPGQPKTKEKNFKTPYPTLFLLELLDGEKTVLSQEFSCSNKECQTHIEPPASVTSVRLTIKETNPEAKNNKDTCIAEILLVPE